MVKKLEDIVGNTAVQMLRDIYIREVDGNTLHSKYGVQNIEIKIVLQKVSKHLVYNARSHNYNITMSNITFHKEDLVKWVWKEFIREKMDSGMTSRDVAMEINQPLEKINSYLF